MKIQLAGLVVVGMLVAACSSGGRPATTTTKTVTTTVTTTSTSRPTPSSAPATDELHNGKTVDASSIMYALRARGFAVTDIQQHAWAYPGSSLQVKINGDPSYLNAFTSQKDAREWSMLLQGFGGVAVVGDTWAISLDCADDPSRCPTSRPLAQKIANALRAEVRQ